MGLESAALVDFIVPKHFRTVLSATQIVCGYGLNEDEERTSKIPSLALKLGHALRKCAVLKQGMGLSKDDVTLQKDAKNFLTLHDIHWSNSISSTALKTLDGKFTKASQVQ